MIELIDIKSPRAVGFRICGKIDKPDLDRVIEAVEDKLSRTEKMGVYVEVESFGGISFDALLDDIKFALPKLNRFDKKAVVSDEAWMANTAKYVNKIFSGIEIRHFTPEEKEEAKKWVAG